MRYLESDDPIFAESTLAINARCWRRYVSEPELEHHQRPEPVPMLTAALDVLGDECAYAVGAEQAAVELRTSDFLWRRAGQ